MKESYRLHKLPLLEEAGTRELNLRILISLSAGAYRKHTEIDFNSLDKAMPVLLDRVAEKIRRNDQKPMDK